MKLELMALLAPARSDPLWEAEKTGWRCFVMSNHRCCYRRGSALHLAWQRGFDAASQAERPELLVL